MGKTTSSFGAALLVLGCGAQVEQDSFSDDEPMGQERSALTTAATRALMITMTSVTRNSGRTEDPCSTTAGDENKVWTIGHLLKREAEKRGVNPQSYVDNWVNAWTSTATVNGDTVPPNVGPSVRTFWQTYSGSTALPLHDAPFYLLAIVNRIDLRNHRPLGEPLGGEVRFVFGMLAPPGPCPSTTTVTTDFLGLSTIILEYSPNKANENDVRDLAQRWLALENLTDASYRSALQTLTEEVINGGRLLRVRTNELFEGQSKWRLTEFEHSPSNFLERRTVKQSPKMTLATGTSTVLRDYIWEKRGDLFANALDFGPNSGTFQPIGSYSVPTTYQGTPFLGGFNMNPNFGQFMDFWDAPAPAGGGLEWIQARFRFSVGTCMGCHFVETGTNFLHISPPEPGTEAALSQFLQGPVDVEDPVLSGWFRSFDEMGRREADLRNLVNLGPVTVPVLGNNYTLRFMNSGKCLDSAGNNNTNGAFSQLYDCHGNGNQRLSFVSLGNGLFSLKYKHSGKCLDVQNGSTSSGARVVQNTCNGSSASQKLALSSILNQPLPSPRVLRFQHSNLCLLVQNQGTANSTAIVQGTCPTQSAQAFKLVE